MAKTVDYGLGEHTFPRGWFMAAEASEVTDKPLAVRFFGRELVLYRGRFVADHHGDGTGRHGRRRGEDVLDHRNARHPVEHLGMRGLHARALAGGEHGDMDVRHGGLDYQGRG